jgi:hypothetical protein
MGDLVRKIDVMKIAVIQGAPAASIQQLFATLVDRWQPSLRLAGGVAEDHGLPDRACSAGALSVVLPADGDRIEAWQQAAVSKPPSHDQTPNLGSLR